MAPADQWRWTDDDGVQRLLNGEELRAALRDGRLKPTTLVWRRGMKSWQPAMSVDELMEGADSVTQERKGGALPGTKRAPSPSIPAPGLGPSNMVNIDQLRSQQHRPRHTMQGVGDPVARTAARSQNLAIPAAPKVPDVGRSSPRPRTTDIDGLWSEGAARRDDDEQTITRLRSVEEDATLNEKQAQKAPSVAPQAKRSVPPPVPKRTVPYTGGADQGQKASRGDAKGGRRKLPSAQGRRKLAGKERQPVPSTLVSASEDGPPRGVPGAARPQLKSDEVLSSALPSTRGMTGPETAEGAATGRRARTGTLNFGGAAAEAVRPAGAAPAPQPEAPEPASQAEVPATAPLPQTRANEQSRPDPEFAQQPWNQPQPAQQVQVATAAPAQPHAPTVDVGALLAPPQFQVPADLPPRSLLPFKLNKPILGGVAGGTVVMLFLAFIVGRCSVPVRSEIAAAVEARTGWATVPLFARNRTAEQLKPPRPCLMQRAPSRWAHAASVRIPIEIVSVPGGKLAVGYARSKEQARGLVVDPATGVAEASFEPKDEYEESLSRVVPVVIEGETSYQPTLIAHGDVQNAVYAPAKTPFVLGFLEAAFVRLADPGSAPETLWALEPPGKSGDALRTIAVGDQGISLTYRYAGRIFQALVNQDGSVAQPASAIAGSGGQVGKPNVGSNGRDVSVVFADRPPKARAAEIRWAHGPIGKPLTESAVVELPAGGPGGEAIAPAIAGLSGGRWLLMWTEGRTGDRTLRAQTYDRKYQTVGEALRVSPSTGSFGQGIIGVVGENAVVVFLLATRRSYEVWGTVLQCE